MSCGVGRRLGSDPALLWLWCKLAATAPIRPLAWEPPYAGGAVLEKAKRQKKKKKRKEKEKEKDLQKLGGKKKMNLFSMTKKSVNFQCSAKCD